MKLKTIRKNRGLTQAELAAKIGRKQSTVALWESGASVPKARMLPALAAALGCTIDDLFDVSTNDKEEKEGEDETNIM